MYDMLREYECVQHESAHVYPAVQAFISHDGELLSVSINTVQMRIETGRPCFGDETIR